MGPFDTDTHNEGFYMDDGSGKWVAIQSIDTFPELSPVEIIPDAEVFQFDGGPSFEFSCTLEWHGARMSRRRFVKLLMGKGVSRNAANAYADDVRSRRVPYGLMWAIRGQTQ